MVKPTPFGVNSGYSSNHPKYLRAAVLPYCENFKLIFNNFTPCLIIILFKNNSYYKKKIPRIMSKNIEIIHYLRVSDEMLLPLPQLYLT